VHRSPPLLLGEGAGFSLLGQRDNPKGGAICVSWSLTAARRSTSTRRVCIAARNSHTVGSIPPKTPARRPRTTVNALRTHRFRRRTQRIAPGSSMSGRKRSATSSMLAARSASAATSSIDCSSPEMRDARQSGINENVSLAAGQYHRAMRVPTGFFRAYVPCDLKPQPPDGCRGHLVSVDSSQSFSRTYSSPVSRVANRNCSRHLGPSCSNTSGHFLFEGERRGGARVISSCSTESLALRYRGDSRSSAAMRDDLSGGSGA
jgi:hypothetical protein